MSTRGARPEPRRADTGGAPSARNVAFLSPWLIGTGLFFVYPLLSTVYFSFTRYDGFTSAELIGLNNWTYVFEHYPFFWPALRNTLWLVVVMVTLRVVFGLGVGLLVTKIKTGPALSARSSTCPTWPRRSPPPSPSPSCSTPAPDRSTSCSASSGSPSPAGSTTRTWSKPTLTLLALWGIGDLMVIFMAALLDVPKEQYEAAELDGAGAGQRFRYVTLPNISPIVMFAVVTGVIQTMQYYTQPLVAGKVASGVIGGSGQQFEPGYPDKSTLTLPQLVYNLGFQRFDIGAACVVALVLFALSMAFTALLMRRRAGLLGD